MNLREYLDEKSITYREFAEKFGIHLQSFKNIAYGVRKPSLDLTLRIETLTEGKVTPRSLFENFSMDTQVKTKRKYISKKVKPTA